MVNCEACGKDVPEGNAVCTSCNTVITPPFTLFRHRSIRRTGGEFCRACSWSRKIPLITNPYHVLQCIFTPFGFAIVMGSFLSIITGGEWALHTLFLVIGAGLSVLMLLIILVLQLVTGGGLETEFFYQ